MISYLPTINALFNLTSAILLLLGRINIKRGRRDIHRKIMISAMISSALFLTGYLFYHSQVGSIPYKHFDWTRPLYFGILIPHSILAAVMTPFIIAAFIYALKGKFDKIQVGSLGLAGLDVCLRNRNHCLFYAVPSLIPIYL